MPIGRGHNTVDNGNIGLKRCEFLRGVVLDALFGIGTDPRSQPPYAKAETDSQEHVTQVALPDDRAVGIVDGAYSMSQDVAVMRQDPFAPIACEQPDVQLRLQETDLLSNGRGGTPSSGAAAPTEPCRATVLRHSLVLILTSRVMHGHSARETA